MSATVLKEDIIERIKKEPALFAGVCSAIGVVPSSLTRLLINNHPKLTQAGVLKIIADHLGVEDIEDLVAPEPIKN